MSHTQAGILIEQVVKEVINSLLSTEEGSYEFISKSTLDDMPKLCHMAIDSLINQHEQNKYYNAEIKNNQNVEFLVNKENNNIISNRSRQINEPATN